jgi:peptide deformylase
MLLDIIQTGDPILRHPAREVAPGEIATPFVQELIASMRQTMRDAPGVGLAAPQIGESLRIAVIGDPGELSQSMSQSWRLEIGRVELAEKVLINPKIVSHGDEQATFFEGCLSVTGFQALVRRWTEVVVTGLDEHGAESRLELSGWPARIVQHELDHLDGKLYIDHMQGRSFTTDSNLGRYWRARPASEIEAALAATSSRRRES